MAKLPSVSDYGARPSLHSNRFDAPDKGGLMLADSIANATATFTQLAGQKKAKDDRLNYALAKNELLLADIASREALREDEDWSTYDERYTNGFNTSRDEIFGRYKLSGSDSALLSAESDLLRERGRSNVADAARGVEIDEKSAKLDGQLETFRELVLVSDPTTANDQMLSALESINAAKDQFLDDEAALAKSQSFVQDVASARLVGMDSTIREKEIERSLAARKSNGPISAEDIGAGKGTGSIADFLPADVLTNMLKVTKDENELNTEYETALSLRDEAMAMYPEDSTQMMKYIRDQSKSLDGKTRARAEQFGRQVAEERRVMASEERADIMISAGDLLAQRDERGRFLYSVHDLPREQLAKLSPGQRSELETYHSMLRNGRQFADFTNWHQEERDDNGDLVRPAYSTWTDMSPTQKAETDLTNPIWHTNFEQGVWKQMADEQERIKSSTTNREKSVQTLDQIVTDVFEGELKQGKSETDSMYHMMRSRIASEVDRISDTEYGGQAVPDDRRKEVARKIMGAAVWERDLGLAGLFGRDSNEPIPAATVDPENYRDYFVPIDRWRSLETKVYIGNPPEPQTITWEKYLENIAAIELNGRKPNPRDLENAYAQIVIGGEPAIVKKRVLEALAGKYEY